jgi:hypothetical protein
MDYNEMRRIVDSLPITTGQSLKQYMGPLCRYDKKRLEKYCGTIETSQMADVILRMRKRGLIEEVELSVDEYRMIINTFNLLPTGEF